MLGILAPKVLNCGNRVVEEHSRATKAHYLTYLLTHIMLIAVNWTHFADRLPLCKATIR